MQLDDTSDTRMPGPTFNSETGRNAPRVEIDVSRAGGGVAKARARATGGGIFFPSSRVKWKGVIRKGLKFGAARVRAVEEKGHVVRSIGPVQGAPPLASPH